MKNLKFFLIAVIGMATSQFATGQELAMVSLSTAPGITTVVLDDNVTIDTKGIVEISNFLDTQLESPIADLVYVNEVRVNVQVSLNKEGSIVAAHVVGKEDSRLGKSIIRTLSKIERVSPILVNGVPTAKTIQIPLVFK